MINFTSTSMEAILKTNPTRHLLPALLVAALSAVYPAAHAQNTTGNPNTANAASPANMSDRSNASGPSHTSGNTASGTPMSGSNADTATDDKAIQNLRAAAQDLRDSIHNLANMPAGEKRTVAMKEGNDALMKVQGAMAALPPSLLTANANENSYMKAIDKLKLASDRLYAAADALANQPPGKDRNNAIKKVNSALIQTNEAMLAGLQVSATNSSDRAMVGSAAVTGRPGGTNVDLSSGSGTTSANKGQTASGTSNPASGSTKEK